VWAADSISAQGSTLTLTSDKSSTRWTVGQFGTFTRTHGNSNEKRWPTALPNIAITASGAQVLVTIPQGPKSRGAQIQLASQLQLARTLSP